MNLVKEIGIVGVLDILSKESEDLSKASNTMHEAMSGFRKPISKAEAIAELTKRVATVELCVEQLERGGLISKGDKAYARLVGAKELEEMFIYKKEEQ